MSDPEYEAMSKAKRQWQSGNPQGAVDTLEAYLVTDPHNTKPRLLLAEIIFNGLKDDRYAMMQLDAVLDMEPENTGALKAAVTVLSKNKRNNKETLEKYEKLLSLEPSAEVYNEYARFLRHQITDFKKAGECYEKAIALDPKKYEYHQNYAVLLLNDLKDWEKARRELEILLEMRPGDIMMRNNYDKLMREKFDRNGNPKTGFMSRFKR